MVGDGIKRAPLALSTVGIAMGAARRYTAIDCWYRPDEWQAFLIPFLIRLSKKTLLRIKPIPGAILVKVVLSY
jgi:cation transport ATPase